MNGGLLHAASALNLLGKMQDTRAQNIANADTTGYRKRIASAEAFANALRSASGLRLPTGRQDVDTAQGNLRVTESPTDLAIHGKGFFALETERGVRFTRNGAFHVNAEGDLVAADGARVLGENGPIQLDPARGPLQVDPTGAVSQGKDRVGRLRIVEFEDDASLVPESDGRYREGPTSLPRDATDSSVSQGFLESSNVNVVDELVQMIAGFRAFEAAQKTVIGIDRIHGVGIGSRR